MTTDKNLILSKKQVEQIIKRIAYEIYEDNYKEKEVYIAGLYENGYVFAQLLQKELQAISPIVTRLIKVTLNKVAKNQPEVVLDIDTSELKNKSVVLTDDVLNTGRALAFSLQPFFLVSLAKLKTAVIVDRDHKLFPVSTDYVGYSLATTLKEHIEVDFASDTFGVYLH